MSVTTEQPYAFGTTVTLSTTLKVGGVATDPTDITLYIKKPGQALITVPKSQLVHPTTGTYSFDVLCNTSGTWWYRFVSTGTAAGAEEAPFSVRTLETQ